MQRLEVSGAVRLIYGSLGVKGLSRVEGCLDTDESEKFWKYPRPQHGSSQLLGNL